MMLLCWLDTCLLCEGSCTLVRICCGEVALSFMGSSCVPLVGWYGMGSIRFRWGDILEVVWN